MARLERFIMTSNIGKVIGSATVGMFGGILLAALCDVLSSTPLGVASAVVVGCGVRNYEWPT